MPFDGLGGGVKVLQERQTEARPDFISDSEKQQAPAVLS